MWFLKSFHTLQQKQYNALTRNLLGQQKKIKKHLTDEHKTRSEWMKREHVFV